MRKRYLEDIVEEDSRSSRKLSRVEKYIKNKFGDDFAVRHPVAVSIAAFLGLQYLKNYFSDWLPKELDKDFSIVPTLAAYTVYTMYGLIKEQIIEARNPGRTSYEKWYKNLYDWILRNPKIVALSAAIASGVTIYKGEESRLLEVFPHLGVTGLPYQAKVMLRNTATLHSILFGIITETIVRSAKNIKKIKRNFRKIKAGWKEKTYNFVMENISLSLIPVAVYEFSKHYSFIFENKPHTHAKETLTGRFLEDIVNYPASVFAVMAQHGVVWSVYFAGLILTGSLFHTQSLKEITLRTAKTYNGFMGRNSKAIDQQKRITALPNSLERTIEDTVELGNLYYEEYEKTQDMGYYGKAFAQYRRALRLFTKKQERISYADYFRKSLKIDKILRYFKRERNKDKVADRMNRIFIDLLNKDDRVLDELKMLAGQDDSHAAYLYGKALEIFGYVESGRVKKELAIRKELKTKETIKESRTKNVNHKYNDDIFKVEIIGKQAPMENLVRELEATRKLREFIRDFEKYDTPLPIGIIKTRGEGVYYMEYVIGETLENVLKDIVIADKKQAVNHLRRAAGFLGLIHAAIKPDSQQRNYKARIKRRLFIYNVNNDLVKRITDNLYPVINSLDGIDIVVNKDAHPGNWIIDEFGDIVSIDFELDGAIPITMDTAKLLSWYEISDEEKSIVLREHLRSFEKYSKRKPEKANYKFALLNSIIIRSLASYSSPRQSREIISISLTNSLKAIEKIKEEFPAEYYPNESAYQELHAAINILRLSSNS